LFFDGVLRPRLDLAERYFKRTLHLRARQSLSGCFAAPNAVVAPLLRILVRATLEPLQLRRSSRTSGGSHSYARPAVAGCPSLSGNSKLRGASNGRNKRIECHPESPEGPLWPTPRCLRVGVSPGIHECEGSRA
jgi:hypothetical protein